MGIVVGREKLEEAIEEATEVLAKTRSISIDGKRAEWLYQRNPDGPAVLWAARDEQTGVMAGFTVCLPRRMIRAGKTVLAWNGADFSILPKYRALGVALKLRRAAKLEIDDGAADLLYSHPNAKMQVIHEKVGHYCVGRMERYAKPLRFGHLLPDFVPKWAGGIIDNSLGRLATMSRSELFSPGSLELRIAPDLTFGDEYDKLFEETVLKDETASVGRLIGVRDAAYLDWRYRQYPQNQFRLIEARKDGKLAGYLILQSNQGVVYVQDVFGGNSEVLRSLVVRAIRIARAEPAQSISMTLLEESQLISILQRLGFRLRPDHSHMFAYSAQPADKAHLTNPGQWHIHVGDRDV